MECTLEDVNLSKKGMESKLLKVLNKRNILILKRIDLSFVDEVMKKRGSRETHYISTAREAESDALQMEWKRKIYDRKSIESEFDMIPLHNLLFSGGTLPAIPRSKRNNRTKRITR